MQRWLFMILVPMVLIFISYNRSCDLKEDGYERDEIFWLLAVFFLVLFAGLRMRYNDTTTYLNTFASDTLTPPIAVFLKQTHFNLSNYWGYMFVKSILKSLGMDNHLILLTYTVFYTVVHCWFIRKYAEDYLPMAMFIFIADGYMMLLAALKQVTATAFALIAIDCYLNHKRFFYAFWILVAVTFHPYVLVLAIVPFIYEKKPWTISTWIIIVSMVALGLGMESTAGVIARFNDIYDVNSILDHTMNPMRFIVSLVPVGISFIYRDILYEDSNRNEDLFAHLSVCRTMFYFWALFGNPIVFARVANYFDFSNAIFLAWAIDKLCMKNETARNGNIYKVGMYVCFMMFSYISGVRGYDFVRQTEHISMDQLMNSISNWMGHIL